MTDAVGHVVLGAGAVGMAVAEALHWYREQETSSSAEHNKVTA